MQTYKISPPHPDAHTAAKPWVAVEPQSVAGVNVKGYGATEAEAIQDCKDRIASSVNYTGEEKP